tara:strand:- start:28 stop:942 length:915 start_codon:yes stop_codon:yes gene_type:complete
MTRAKDISKIVSDADFGGTLDVGGAFTSLGIDDNANATAITIDSSENVLVGTTTVLTAESNVEGISLASGSYGGLLSVSRASARSATFNRKTNDGDIIQFRKDGTAVGSIASDSGSMLLGSGDVGVYFDASSDRILPMNMSTLGVRNDAIDIGGNPHRFKDIYLAGGAFLGGTGTANKLDDYEEGTWTPTLAGSSNRLGTWSSITGRYIKIGRVVFLQADITGSAMRFSATSGFQQIGGNIPFAASQPSGSQNYSGTWSGNTVAYSSSGSVYLYNTTIYLHSSNSGQASDGVGGIGVTITYFTA